MIKKILIIVLILVVAADVTLTLWGQPPEYWSNMKKNIEENPIGAYLLSRHWVWFIIFILGWVSFLVFMVKWLIRPLDIIFGVGITIGHVSALQSWLEKLFQLSPLIRPMDPSLTAAAIFIAVVLIFNILLKRKKQKKK